MKILDFLDKLLQGILIFLTSSTIFAGVLLAFINVVVRFVFNKSIEWAFELTSYLFIYSALFAAAYLFRKGAHIKVTLFLDTLPDTLAKVVIILVDIINLLYLAIVAYFTYIFIFDADLGIKASGEVSVDLGVQMWIVYLVLPISAIFGIFMVIFKLKDDILTPAYKLRKKEEFEIIEELEEEFEVEK